MGPAFQEYRCKTCKKLLCKAILVEGDIEIKCKNCHAINNLVATQFNNLLCAIANCPGRVTVQDKKSK